MSKFTSAVRTFIADEEGVTAIEYGMIAALIAALIVTTVDSIGEKVLAGFEKINDAWI